MKVQLQKDMALHNLIMMSSFYQVLQMMIKNVDYKYHTYLLEEVNKEDYLVIKLSRKKSICNYIFEVIDVLVDEDFQVKFLKYTEHSNKFPHRMIFVILFAYQILNINSHIQFSQVLIRMTNNAVDFQNRPIYC